MKFNSVANDIYLHSQMNKISNKIESLITGLFWETNTQLGIKIKEEIS